VFDTDLRMWSLPLYRLERADDDFIDVSSLELFLMLELL
jgi:hypothetical protein